MPQRPNSIAQNSAPVPQMMSAKDAAAYCGIDIFALYRLTSAKAIKARVWGKGGRNLKWLRSDLDAWIAALPVKTGPVRGRPVARREPEPAA